jgi:hypothetical protein
MKYYNEVVKSIKAQNFQQKVKVLFKVDVIVRENFH